MSSRISFNQAGINELLNNTPGLKAALSNEAEKLAGKVRATATTSSRQDAAGAKVSLSKSDEIGFTKLSKRDVANVTVTFTPGVYEKNTFMDVKNILDEARRRR